MPKFFFLALCLYADYALIGIGQIAVAQHMESFMERFTLDAAGVAFIIAGTGFGRAVGNSFAGFLSDAFGRRPVILAGTAGLMVSFAGLAAAPTADLAFAAVLLGGVADSLIDAGTFPVLAEAFPESAAAKVVGTKVAMSVGQILFPLFVVHLLHRQAPGNIAFWTVAALALINVLVLLRLAFPAFMPAKGVFRIKARGGFALPVRRSPSLTGDALPLLVFAVPSCVAFVVAMIWMPFIAREAAGATTAESLTTVSFFAAGSVAFGGCALLFLRRRVRAVMLLAVLPLFTTAAALAVWAYPTLTVCRTASFVIGAAAGGGIVQTAASVLMEFFPAAKARMAAAFLLIGAASAACANLVLGGIAGESAEGLMLVNAAAGLACALLGVFVVGRYYRTFVIAADSRRLGETRLMKYLGVSG